MARVWRNNSIVPPDPPPGPPVKLSKIANFSFLIAGSKFSPSAFTEPLIDKLDNGCSSDPITDITQES
jgi:hypothetical protein